MYDKDKLLEAFSLIQKAIDLIESLPVELEPLEYTEPVNKIILALDEVYEGIEEVLAKMNEEA